jgi:purine-nucleoside/S-methyl-5'-thioadenosine phosphorylase / adenosine deaminase
VISEALHRAGRDWIVPDWPVSSRVEAVVTTRNGGVSTGRYASLNLGAASATRAFGDAPINVAENRARVRALLPAEPAWLAQVHGTSVHTAEAATPDVPPIADAAVTRTPNVVLAVQSADCLPVLLADRDGAAIGIAHAGWRGLAAGVVDNAVRALAVPPERVVAWLGPAIGPDAFEVGADVRDAFVAVDADADAAFRPKGPGKWRADLYALARQRLARCGVRDVHGGGACTYSEPARFFSYRRDGDTGRMAALLWLR